MKIPSDEEKAAVWKAYHEGKPTRIPLRWNTNPRIILLDPTLNPEGYTFEQYSHDPTVLLIVQSRWQEYLATTLSRVCDFPAALPERWNFYVDSQNTYDGAYFGGKVVFEAGQCPSNLPSLTMDDVDAFLTCDFSHPLENPWIRDRLAFHAELDKAAADFTYRGRKGTVAPFHMGFDGPLTVAAVLMGADIFALLGENPEEAVRFMRTLVEAAVIRHRALVERTGTPWKPAEWAGTADDSIQLISTAMYEEHILPLHELWYSRVSITTPASRRRSIHLCGDATRHFPIIARKLGVVSFDTGFPVDHGALRRALGPGIEISGGPQVQLLHDGTPSDCAARTRQILQSGIKDGGRFILQEGNNLPPGCSQENLAAVYETCLACGGVTAAPG